MGNTRSLEQEEPDPWWRTNQTQHSSNQNESQQASCAEPETTVIEKQQEDVMPLHAMWYQRERVLGQTIQHLAEENMRISSARRAAEKRLKECEVEAQHNSEELEKLRSDAEKAQQVFEKLHAQIQSGREDRQMITMEMERIRNGFDAEREAKEELITEMRKLREERDESRKAIEYLTQELNDKVLLVERAMESLNHERKEKEYIAKELESVREELKATKASLALTTDDLQAKELMDQPKPEERECPATEESIKVKIRSPEALAEMERFQVEMSSRREARQRAMQAVSTEMERLRTELNTEREARLKAEQQLQKVLLQAGKNEKSKQEEALALELEHAKQTILSDKRRLQQVSQENSRLQFELENGKQILAERTDDLEKLQMQLDSEREHTQSQIDALKEVATICKEMLNVREGQVMQLKEKLKVIETSVTNKVHEKLPVDLKTEYETQMENIRSLKSLYEQRMKIMMSEKEKLIQDSEEKSQRLDEEIKKSALFEQQLADMKLSLEEKEEENSNLQIQLDDSQDKSHGLAKELTLINNLFTQMLIGNTATDMDLDRLTRLLQENHDLITDITIKENSSEIAAVLPKLLLDLVNQVDSGTASASSTPTGERNDDVEVRNEADSQNCPSAEGTDEPAGAQAKNSSEDLVNGMAVQDIALNLPKVWKVLMELLSHHIAPTTTDNQEEKANSCYKSIDTPKGPRLVISVSQTFLRLKDLILEKKSLQRELDRLKHLNNHLERKLTDQEDKLSMVSTELRKTWNVVDQMQTQHQKLHTHEKILRYELQEKRKLLSELKQELEYCREKWERARQKNSESEVEWKKLRQEFAARKKQPNDALNNSGESGFLDERGDDSSEDDDATNKDTGQLDPGSGGDIRTSSPLETNLINSSPLEMTPTHNSNLQSNKTPSEMIFDLESDSLPNTDCQAENITENSLTFNPEPQLQPENLCLKSFNIIQENANEENIPDCKIDSSNNCSTISIITLLKQQLAFFSRNLDYISSNTNDMSVQNLEALQSIFSLPPIQIPKEINDTVQNCFQNFNIDSCFEQDVTCDSNSYFEPSTSTTSSHNEATFMTEHKNTQGTNSSPLESSSSEASYRASNLEEQSSESHSQDTRKSSVGKSCPTKTTETTKPNRTAEEIAEARAARLKRLEEQCQQLYNKVTRTTHRSTALCNRLEELHEQFRRSESPPGIRNDSTSSSDIPVPPPFPPSTLLSTSTSPLSHPSNSSVNRRYKSRTTETSSSSIPTPPPLPCDLPSTRIPSCIDSAQTTVIPTPPPLPRNLPSRRIPTETENSHVSSPPPSPSSQNPRGRRLSTCSTGTLRNVSDLQDSTNQGANETTRQNSNDLQRQEESEK